MSSDLAPLDPIQALWQAIGEAHPYKLIQALDRGADPNALPPGKPDADPSQATPLSCLLLSTAGQKDSHSTRKIQLMLTHLLDAGASTVLPSHLEQPYQTAVKLDHRACNEAMFARLLVGVDPATINMQVRGSSRTMTALGHAFHSRNVGRARQLIQRGADPWAKLGDGQPCWISVARANPNKTIDRYRHPHAARLMREIAKQRSGLDTLEVVEVEFALWQERAVMRDGYGAWAIELLLQWLVVEGDLSRDDLKRLAKCMGQRFSLPLPEMINAGLDPNMQLPDGQALIWHALESGEMRAFAILIEHPSLDMTVLSPKGETLVQGLRRMHGQALEKQTRERWISRVEGQLLGRSTAEPLPRSQPPKARL